MNQIIGDKSLQVLVRVRCDKCQGKGKYPNPIIQAAAECGFSTANYVNKYLGDQVKLDLMPHDVECEKCKGRGYHESWQWLTDVQEKFQQDMIQDMIQDNRFIISLIESIFRQEAASNQVANQVSKLMPRIVNDGIFLDAVRDAIHNYRKGIGLTDE